MYASDRSRTRRACVRLGLPATLLALLVLPAACKDEAPSAPAARQEAVPARAAAHVTGNEQVVALGTDLLLPLTDTVTSGVPAFEIKQKGGGIAGRFEITNPSSSAIALDGVSSGTGHALLAWNLGRGRGAVVITSNSANTLPALDVSSQSLASAADIRANNSLNVAPALKARTIGLGPAAELLVDRSANAAAALRVAHAGTGSAGEFIARTSTLTTPALSIVNSGNGRGLLVNHTGSEGNLAVFQTGGSNKARINRFGKGYFNGGTQTGGADVAEAFAVEGRTRDYEPGDVLVISARSDRTVERSAAPYSTLVAGVYATKPGVLLTERHVDASLDDLVPMGVVGVIPTKVSAENGAIGRGDLLVTAATPGHAMRAAPVVVNGVALYPTGAVLGKAVEPFAGPGTGVIRVLVNVQ